MLRLAVDDSKDLFEEFIRDAPDTLAIIAAFEHLDTAGIPEEGGQIGRLEISV